MVKEIWELTKEEFLDKSIYDRAALSEEFKKQINISAVESVKRRGRVIPKRVMTVKEALDPSFHFQFPKEVLDTEIHFASKIRKVSLRGFTTGKTPEGERIIAMHPEQATADYVPGLLHELKHVSDILKGKEVPVTEMVEYKEYRRLPAERRARRAEVAMIYKTHKYAVHEALKRGKKVPIRVLEDYPELKAGNPKDKKKCALDLPYGGIPSGGYFGSYTEYEVGAQRLAEAAHCILGSLHKVKYRPADIKKQYPGITIEEGHIREELDLINRIVKEYGKPLYIERLAEGEFKYSQESIDTIPNKSKVLRERAEELKKNPCVTGDSYDVAMASYDVLIALANAMEESIEKLPKKWSAFRDGRLTQAIAHLNYVTERALATPKSSLGSTTVQHRGNPMAEEEKREEPEVERFRLVGKRIPDEMKAAIRELGDEMPIDFVEMEAEEEGSPELTIETRCGKTTITEPADKARLAAELTMVSCERIEQKQREEAVETEKKETIPEEKE